MPDSAKQLNANSLQQLDRGKVAAALAHALRQCTLDIQDRPGDKSARKVVLVISQRPELDKNSGTLDTVAVDFKVRVAIPDRQSLAYPMLPTADGTLVFQPDSPMDPRQTSFNFGQVPPTVASPTPPPEDMDPETGEVPDVGTL